MRLLFSFVLPTLLSLSAASGAELKVGHASCDITPDKPVCLAGSTATRISKEVAMPLSANVLALEGSRGGENAAVILISIDTISFNTTFTKAIRDGIAKELPDFNLDGLILMATHTHNAPITRESNYAIPQDGSCMLYNEYNEFLVSRLAPTVAKAWNTRQPAKFSYGLGHATVGSNRRAVYADGTATMYGKTDKPEFQGIEGMDDPDVGTMFFWDLNDNLLAMLINVSCPSQWFERGPNHLKVSADFWYPARVALKGKYGRNVTILASCGAAGDLSPHLLYRTAAEARMARLRKLERFEELARRIVHAVDETYEPAKLDRKTDVPLAHRFRNVPLTPFLVSEEDVKGVKARIAEYEKQAAKVPEGRTDYYTRVINTEQAVLKRYEREQKMPKPAPPVMSPVHALRIGDTLLLTNQFELYTDYGVRMKARSKAVQTFVVQLVGGGSYLPTEEGYRHGGYSATPRSLVVGPVGGAELVEESLKSGNDLF